MLGAGWLGLPLAQYLRAQGYSVNASRTTEAGVAELAGLGLNAFQLVLDAATSPKISTSTATIALVR